MKELSTTQAVKKRRMKEIKRDKNKCPNNAGFAVPWGGKILKLCHIHANGMVVLGNVIGSPIQVEPIISFDQCQGANDLEEYKQNSESKER